MTASWLFDLLACPRHKSRLNTVQEHLVCEHGCRFPLFDGIPVMLMDDVEQTIGLAAATLQQMQHAESDHRIDTLGISAEQKQQMPALMAGDNDVDPVVSQLVAATNGIAYEGLVGKLKQYPIPAIRLPKVDGDIFLDLGCSWGRWCIAAGLKGYRVIGLDPSLEAVMAARRLAARFGINACFIVGDARHLPLLPAVIDQAYSYSVLQHFSRQDAALAVTEIGRVLRPGGHSLVQMPNWLGIRCLYHQFRRRFREAEDFDVRYWTLADLKQLFGSKIGPAVLSVDCFFGLGLQYSDLRFMSPWLKPVVLASEMLRRLSQLLPPLVWVADSVFISCKTPDQH